MDNHHFEWENPLFLWPFSIAMFVYQRASPEMTVYNFTTAKLSLATASCSCVASVNSHRHVEQ